MSIRLRSKWLSGAGALLLVFTLSGVAAGAALINGTAPTEPVVIEPAPAVDTTATFEDTDGNGVDDDCQTAVVPDAEAAVKALAAIDLDGNGTISASEAAQSDRTGGKDCNHGGYVSGVAKDQGDEVTEAAEPVPAACVATVPPVPPVGAAPTVVVPNTHGKAVSAVAQSDAVGGKHCNHGGAVSEVAKTKVHAPQGQAAKGHAAAGQAKSKAGKSHAADRAAKSHGKGHGRDR